MMKRIAAAAILLAGLAAPSYAQQAQPYMMGPGYGMGGYGMMMGGGMPMMGMPMMGMSGGQHVDGRLAFLKTELKITAAQEDAWKAYADAFRANAGRMNALMQEMMPNFMAGNMGGNMMGQGQGMGMMNQAGAKPLTVPERLDLAERHMAAHVEMLAKMKEPTLKLYESLGAEQKKVADQLLMGPMGMM